MTNTIRVTVNRNSGTLSPSNPVTLKNTPALVIGAGEVENLTDVAVANLVTGATLVYNLSNDTYEVKPLDVYIGNLDGGTF